MSALGGLFLLSKRQAELLKEILQHHLSDNDMHSYEDKQRVLNITERLSHGLKNKDFT